MNGQKPSPSCSARQEHRKHVHFLRLKLTVLVLLLLIAAMAIYAAVRGKTPVQTEPAVQTTAPQAQTAAPTETRASSSVTTSAPEPDTTVAPAEDDSWKLVLVNADHPLPEGFTVRLKPLRYGQQVDERIYPELQQMFDDARAAGIYPLINESYRTAERQQEILDKYIANYEAGGMRHEDAVKKARSIVALPGTSEHELGLALDIIAEFDADSTATWTWLRENSWRYGFILRYPAGKEEITGISFEAWHFRYVGVPTAQEITEQGLCLEEYLENRE
ncbi:MAG: M15 family metallopeptidase [Clostridia bacterium]|nr:M15 family metallopeptidase [Clostridia bacterium]